MAYQTDEELKLQIKLWFKTYGIPILAGILLGIALIGGWQIWKKYTAGRIENAANLYQQMTDKYASWEALIQTETEENLKDEHSADLANTITKQAQNAIAAPSTEEQTGEKQTTDQQSALLAQEIDSIAKQLKADYSDTHYGFLAAMLGARKYSQNKAYPQAVTELQWVLGQSKDSALNPVVELRLAELFWQQNKIAEARLLLTKQVAPAFIALYKELLGDMELSVNNQAAAKAAYQEAFIHALGNPIQMQTLRIKIDYLAGVAVEPVSNSTIEPIETGQKKSTANS